MAVKFCHQLAFVFAAGKDPLEKIFSFSIISELAIENVFTSRSAEKKPQPRGYFGKNLSSHNLIRSAHEKTLVLSSLRPLVGQGPLDKKLRTENYTL